MNHRRPLGRRDDPGMTAGDNVWMGVNLKLDPSRLPPGYCSEAVNMRFRNGVAETRLGSIVPPWLNKITGSSVGNWGAVYGVGEFRDPTTFTEYVLLAADGYVYACVENNAPYQLSLPMGVTITDRVTFIQCYNVVLLLRGFDADPLVMDDINQGFKAIVPTTYETGDGTLTIPRALRGVFAANRVFLLREDDTVVASDILDYTRYTLFNDFKVNQGDADKGVAIAAFGQASLIVFKERSVYRIDSVYGLLDEISFSLVTNRYGCVAADSVQNCGSDVLWLSQEGVASLTLTELNEIQASQGALAGKNRMFSEDIGPLVERANGNYVQNAFGAVWNDRYYLGLPIDQAEVLGPEMAFPMLVLTTYTAPLVVGATYRFNSDVGKVRLTDGTQVFDSDSTFIATTTSGVLSFPGFYPPNAVVVPSLKRVYRTNNALAHYDFQNSAWGGYDEADAIAFKYLFTASYLGRRRLFAITHDGYARMWEEGYADRLSQPYIDLTLLSAPSTGNTLRINSGTTVTADAAAGANVGTTWGTNTVENARLNLWFNGTSTGYSLQAASPWTTPSALAGALPVYAPATILTQSTYGITGIRVTATNGILPTIVTTGSWASITYGVEQDILTTFTTRGYTDPGGDRLKVNVVEMDLQTWAPSLALTVQGDGVNESETVSGTAAVTRSRTAYTRTGASNIYGTPFNDWVDTNANDDFNNPHREDYSILQTGTSWSILLHDGIRTDLHQEARYRYAARTEARAARIGLVNSAGRVRVMQCRLEKTPLATPAGVST